MADKRVFYIDKTRCSVCGLCADICPVEAISQYGPYQIDETLCMGCGMCQKDCPSGAIKVKAE
jgi:formate hydrogenlyase subunit 6/NADH:ubiquinone oxidoreductase subunit I